MKILCKMQKKKDYTHVYIHLEVSVLNYHLILSGADEQTETFQIALLMYIRTTW